MLIDAELTKLRRNLEIVVPSEGLAEKLMGSLTSGKPLRIKLGFDPTAPDLHLGHAVVLRKMREFQDFGHQIVIIIGDFTACIGDPTGRNKTRPPLTQDEVRAHAQTYLDQLSKMLDLSKTEIHFNSEWFDKMSLRDVVGLVSQVTLSQILQREDFSTRYRGNVPIYFHELLYPLIQGYDSLMIESDVEMGGTDQLFNCLVGRDIQSLHYKKQQIVACVPLLRGTDGHHKMSKSLNNYIGLTEDPHNMYGKVMSIPDDLIEEYAALISRFSTEKIEKIHSGLSDGSLNPMETKKELAFDIVEQFHGPEAARSGADYFYKQVQSRDDTLIEFAPVFLRDMKVSFSGLTMLALCSLLMQDKSKGDLRRLIQGGGVTLNGEKILDPTIEVMKLTQVDFKLKIGKRGFYEIFVGPEQ